MPNPDQPDPYATPWPLGPIAAVPMMSGPRDPKFRFSVLSDGERDELVASRPAPELTARVLGALRAWTPDASDGVQS